jgi:hypothetical protein
MDLYGHLFEGSDKESAERMQKLFGSRDEATAVPGENVVAFPTPRNRA